MKTVYDVILRPIITEDSMSNADAKRYFFEVKKDATKPEIAAAIEAIFNVNVESVHTMNVKGKTKRNRSNLGTGKTASWKKAIVTLTADSKTIEFFDGMM